MDIRNFAGLGYVDELQCVGGTHRGSGIGVADIDSIRRGESTSQRIGVVDPELSTPATTD